MKMILYGAEMLEESFCEICEQSIDEVNVETFEITGQLLCEDCSADALEAYSEYELLKSYGR